MRQPNPSLTNTLYPIYNSVEEAWDHYVTQLPITTHNELFKVLASYHSTLLRIEDENTHDK